MNKVYKLAFLFLLLTSCATIVDTISLKKTDYPIIARFNNNGNIKIINIPTQLELIGFENYQGFTSIEYFYNNNKGTLPKYYEFINNDVNRLDQNKLKKISNKKILVYSRHFLDTLQSKNLLSLVKNVPSKLKNNDSLIIGKYYELSHNQKEFFQSMQKGDSLIFELIDNNSKMIFITKSITQ